MEISLYNQNVQGAGTIGLDDRVFNVPLNRDLVFQVVTSQQSNQRQPVAKAKDRSEVRGGGRKPWRQKGTGRARHGSIRSPIWRGGGVTFGPTPEKSYRKKINRKAARKALTMALSAKVRDGEVVIVDTLSIEQAKSREVVRFLEALNGLFSRTAGRRGASTLLVIPKLQGFEGLVRATRNIPRVDILEARDLNALTTLTHQRLVLLKETVSVLEQQLQTA